MRLLDTETGQFVDRDPEWTVYAILSHVWDEEGEQTYEQLKNIQRRYKFTSHVPGPQRRPGGASELSTSWLARLKGESRMWFQCCLAGRAL